MLDANEHFFACVPWFARYAYEVLVLPREPVTSLVDLDDDDCRDLGTVLRDVVRRYDALWGIRMPYVLAVHQAPVGDHPHYPFHVELHPPLRAPGLLKYLAGPEIGGGSMTNESDPDEKAAELRDALALSDARDRCCSARSATTCATSWSARAAWTWPQSTARPAPTRSTPSTRSPTTRSSTGSRQHWPDVELVSEGLDEPVVIGADPQWTVIVDSIDGTRGLMYDKRPAWCLAAAAPRGGSLRDVVAAAMTELPTTKQGLADQLSGTRGSGRRRRAHRPPRRRTRSR